MYQKLEHGPCARRLLPVREDMLARGEAVVVAEGFAWPTKEVGGSVRGFSFDHVFVRGLGRAGAVAGVARDVKDASDHRPVWADVRVDTDLSASTNRHSATNSAP